MNLLHASQSVKEQTHHFKPLYNKFINVTLKAAFRAETESKKKGNNGQQSSVTTIAYNFQH